VQLIDRPRVAAAILVVTAAVLLLAGTSDLPLLDRDEPRFSHATIEMYDRGNWVVPYFNDEYRFDKPPLTYWLMAGGYAIAGIGEFGARLHAILASLAMTLVVFLFGRRLVGNRAAFGAAFAWSTCVQVFLHGRLAVADMPMILAVAVMHWALWELLRSDGGRGWQLTLWVAAALGFLAKGPIALAVPAVTLLVARLLAGPGSVAWRRLGALWGVPLSLAMVGAWGIPALLQTGGAFWDVGIGEHVVRRGTAAFNDRPIVPGYYFVTVLLSLFPWSPNLGQLPASLRGRWREFDTAFLLGWLAGPFVIFSFYSTQLPHYTLPAFPALLYLLLRGETRPEHFSRASKWFYWILHGLIAVAFTTAVVYLKWIDVPAQLRDLKVAIAALAGAMLALQAAAVLFGRRRDPGPGFPAMLTMVAAAAVATALFASTVRPISAPLRLVPFYQRVPAEALHTAQGYTEPSLIFYSDTFWRLGEPVRRADLAGPVMVLYRGAEHGLDRLLAPGAGARRREAVAACGSAAAGDGGTVAGSLETVNERARAARVPRFVIDSDLSRAVVCGFNFARSTWTEILVFYRE
jgi:4-amino-4-deoxy-L-arabinose transferase-like glycosyltransferase